MSGGLEGFLCGVGEADCCESPPPLCDTNRATGVSGDEKLILIHIDFSSHGPQTSFNATKDPTSPEAAADRVEAGWRRYHAH